jgi:hypothetical protein
MDEVIEDEELVTVGKFLAPTEAQMAKGMLEAAGIECFLQGENANNMLALAFRVRLRVRGTDADLAEELLQAAELGELPQGGYDA